MNIMYSKVKKHREYKNLRLLRNKNYKKKINQYMMLIMKEGQDRKKNFQQRRNK